MEFGSGGKVGTTPVGLVGEFHLTSDGDGVLYLLFQVLFACGIVLVPLLYAS